MKKNILIILAAISIALSGLIVSGCGGDSGSRKLEPVKYSETGGRSGVGSETGGSGFTRTTTTTDRPDRLR